MTSSNPGEQSFGKKRGLAVPRAVCRPSPSKMKNWLEFCTMDVRVTSRRTASEGWWKHKLEWDGLRVRRWRDMGRSEERSLLRS